MLEDRKMQWPVVSREVLGQGRVSSFVNEVVETPDGASMERQFLTHPGAVAIVPWDEERDEIALLQQYRHPVRMELVEIPAGLLDVAGEAWNDAAVRELAEEIELKAARWDVLVDMATTPGACEETIRIFLARGLECAERPEGFELEGEEAHMTWAFHPRQEVVDAVMAGRVQSPTLVAGILALETARLSGRLDQLRSLDAPWPIRE